MILCNDILSLAVLQIGKFEHVVLGFPSLLPSLLMGNGNIYHSWTPCKCVS